MGDDVSFIVFVSRLFGECINHIVMKVFLHNPSFLEKKVTGFRERPYISKSGMQNYWMCP
jgi:hypothetical protein